MTIGRCHVLETLVLNECSVSADWRTSSTRVISRRLVNSFLIGFGHSKIDFNFIIQFQVFFFVFLNFLNRNDRILHFTQN